MVGRGVVRRVGRVEEVRRWRGGRREGREWRRAGWR